MNVATFMGNLGRDAELKSAANGEAAANFSMAVAVGSKAEPETMWVRCSLYGKRAESLHRYLIKGQKVVVTGRVRLSSWQDKDGVARTDLRLNVQDLWFAGSRPEGGDDPGREVAGHRAAAPSRERVAPKGASFEDDEIPF